MIRFYVHNGRRWVRTSNLKHLQTAKKLAKAHRNAERAVAWFDYENEKWSIG